MTYKHNLTDTLESNEQTEQKTRQTVRRFLGYIKPFKLLFLVAVIGMIGYALIDTYVLAQAKPLIDDSLNNNDYTFLKLAAYLIVPIFILRGIFNFMGTYTLEYIGTKVVMKMRQELFEKFIHLPVEYHDHHSSGSLISKTIYDTEQVRWAAGKALLTLVREGMFVVGILFVMFYYSWKLSLIFFLIGPLVAVIVSVVSKRFRKVSKAIQQAMGTLTAAVEQAVKGHKVVLMHDAQSLESERFAEKNNQNRLQNMKLATSQILSVSTIQVIASIALAFVFFAASLPALADELTAGIFINVIFLMVMLLKPLKQLTTVNTEFQKGMAACSSIFEVLDNLNEVDTGTKEIEQAKGKLSLKNITFTYPTKDTPAINDVSFDVKPGQTVALVGRSGSGKSTLSNLLTRFYSPQAGQILLDDININDLSLRSLRRQFALVSQQVILFNDTIANNIAYGMADKVSREEIIKAADVAHVTDFVMQEKDGFDTIVGENGLTLSGGQRQRIAIARAILADAPVLILDEATSALDTESEKYIQHALDEFQKSRTSIVVAHRLSTIENADLILVVEQGEIVESGTHLSLLERKGVYSQLHALQFSQ
ncbi:lipid A export permease/ATP-binding protein MsbA [Glaciecola petra]|uniref:Lipid A export permease/ATP-binding protein MsbA n=1 Tax=Glaciecola petra TaxID=3075602 RepID=A0ABU2ZPZ2_9ALTE|nr:lipid A export permease/ATP-binding protein MsbA [Aestuariibacter sp. P117]MDT0594486.1 lipid A export permease/ATP-binding protein MsbA [Aestuariibacter sp. P117]